MSDDIKADFDLYKQIDSKEILPRMNDLLIKQVKNWLKVIVVMEDRVKSKPIKNSKEMM